MLKKEGKEVSEILQKAKDHIETALAKHIKNILKDFFVKILSNG